MHIRAPEQCKGVHPGPKYAIEFPMPTCDATQRRAVNLSKKTLLVHSLLSPIFSFFLLKQLIQPWISCTPSLPLFHIPLSAAASSSPPPRRRGLGPALACLKIIFFNYPAGLV